jgi:trehalose/maltose transport system substrate-binding protein
MQHKRFSLATLLVLVSLILAACGGGGGTGASTPAPAGGGAATQPPAATEAPAAATEAPAAATEAPTGETATEAAEGGTEPGFSAVAPAGLRSDLQGSTITVVLGADGPGTPWEDAVIAKFTEATGITVNRIAGAQSATERLAQYLQQWGAQSADVDVYMIDVIWPGIAAAHAADLNPAMSETIGNYFPAIVENNTVDGKLVGVPWYTDAGLLYYRTDLLEKYNFDGPPETWVELEEMSNTIQEGERGAGLNDFWGFVWQGKAYEGLTCDALEWQVSNGGGNIIEPDGTVSVNNPQTIAAFERAKRWIGTISPEGITTYTEPESLNVFTAGSAAFMRNWPYAYAVSNEEDSKIKGNVAVTVLPKGDGENARNAATLGGWQLMVSNYSQNQDAAFEFVKYMTSPEIQKSAAIERTLLPTIASVYEDADVLEANPYYADLLPVFQGGAVPRPSTVSGELYNDVSTAYFTAVNQILTGQKDAATAVAEIEQQLNDIMATK